MIKNLRQSWTPPEKETPGFRTRLEPGKLKIKNPYINDSRDNYDQVKEERKRELEEVRKSFCKKKDHDHFHLEYPVQSDRQRCRSEMKLKMSDDFWVKERNTKLDEERVRIGIELENVKTTRQLFVEDFPSR